MERIIMASVTIMASITIMTSVTYGKCYLWKVLLMASEIMANVFFAKVLWQVKFLASVIMAIFFAKVLWQM